MSYVQVTKQSVNVLHSGSQESVNVLRSGSQALEEKCKRLTFACLTIEGNIYKCLLFTHLQIPHGDLTESRLERHGGEATFTQLPLYINM